MRKVAALKLGGLTAAVGAELAQARLLSVYEALAADDIWGVRKACVESLPEIANALPVDVRAERLVPLLRSEGLARLPRSAAIFVNVLVNAIGLVSASIHLTFALLRPCGGGGGGAMRMRSTAGGGGHHDMDTMSAGTSALLRDEHSSGTSALPDQLLRSAVAVGSPGDTAGTSGRGRDRAQRSQPRYGSTDAQPAGSVLRGQTHAR